VTHLTDADGTIIEKYRYDAFGTPVFYNGDGGLIQTTAFNNRYLFTGREYFGAWVYDYRARVYHAGIGRFMSEDPKLFDAGDYNLFRYCHNDPIDMTDPMGLTETSDFLAGFDSFATFGIASAAAGHFNPSYAAGISTNSASYKAGMVVGAAAGVFDGGTELKAIRMGLRAAAERKAATLAENRVAGKAFENTTQKSLNAAHPTVEGQVTLRTESGTRTRVDFVHRDVQGNVGLTEAKSSGTARLTPNQAKAFPEIQQSGATVMGAGKPAVPGGTQIPPTKVEIVRPPILIEVHPQ
jgi:RHS repeat-associated protein